jgi:hypothetical protein
MTMPVDILMFLFRPFLDDALVQVKRMIDGGAREKMMFSKHTLPVFIGLPTVPPSPRTFKEKIV